MNESSMSAACRAFARELAAHVDALRQHGAMSAHAVVCPSCARRVKLAAALGDHLGGPPTVPVELSSPAFLASIHERAIDTFERTPVGVQLTDALRVVAPVEQLPWPLQVAEDRLAARLAEPVRANPAWLWRQARARAVSQPQRRTASVGMLAAVAASVALLAVFGWRIGRSEGTTTDLQIVFVPVSELPSAMHPTAALRLGVVR